MTNGELFVGLYALSIAGAAWIGFKIVEHRRAARARELHTPAE